MHRTKLTDIPEEVINSTVLQHLRVNELLRLRRVCRWTKVISDDYLLFHPRSTKTISIALNSSEDGEYESLETFLEMDTRSSIMQPSKHLQLICSNKNIPSCPCWKKPDILNILKKYGRKITHLKVSHLTIPLKDHELKFYEQLPNLKGLSTDRLFVSRISQIEFHKSFKKIEKLKIKRCNETTSSVFWEMVKFCTNLDTLVVPSNLFFNGGNIEDVGEKCKLKTINLRFQEEYFKYSNATEEIQRDFCEISVEDDLKWENVPASMFDHFMQSTLQVIAPQIVSIKRLAGFECIQETLFPCVEKVHIESPFNHYVEQNMLTKFLTAKSFPALKKLKISLRSGRFDSSDDYDLAYIWSQVPNLEEIDFTGSHDRDPTDNIFIGAGSVERNFLQLTKLRKLNLGKIQPTSNLTDASFIKVFRYLKLLEFRMDSTGPLKFITCSGIRALLDGPFYKTIEIFSFPLHCLRNGDNNELQKLQGLSFAV